MRDGQPWDGKLYDKVIALLAYLVAESERSHPREHLSALLWPALPAEAARTNLRQTLYYLRRAFGPEAGELLHASRESVRFHYSTSHCWIDLKNLTEQAPTCSRCPTTPGSPPCEPCLARFKARADSYQGEFLAGLSLADAPDFDVWLDAQRHKLRGHAFSCAERLRNAYETLGRLGPALAYAQRCVQLEPWNEAGHREHMRLLACKGQHGTAETLYDVYRDALARDLSVEPDRSTQALFETIHKREVEPEAPLQAAAEPDPPQAATGRRQATILCCHVDLAGEPADDSPEQLAGARSLCAAILRRHAGHIAQGQGGYIYAYLGYPEACENAGELAVQTAVELQARFSKQYRIRAGIHTGIILAGFDPALPDIVGDVSAGAWRLCRRLQKSGIVISDTTRRLIHDRFTVEALKPLKTDSAGAQEAGVPMPAFRLIDSRQPAGPGRTASPSTALVGRKAELRRLSDAWAQARWGNPQFLVVRGEAGIGKSRLALALRDTVPSANTVVRHLHCFPEHQHTPLYPIIALFESAMGFRVNDTRKQQRDKLDRYLAQHHGAVANEARPILMDMLAIAPDDAPVLPPRQRKLQTLDMILTLLDSRAARQTVLLIIEDAHWLDITSLDLLERLIKRQDRLALFTLVTARPEFRPAWLEGNSVFDLAPLGNEHIARLARSTSRNLSRQAVERIVERADGIPLYAHEMAQLAADTADCEAIPASLNYLFLVRLEAVPQALRTVQLAATLGRKFERGLLQRIGRLDDQKLDETLAQLVEARLIAPAQSRVDAFQFHHALIQEAAYSSQIQSDRQEAHRRVALALEHHYCQRAAQQPGEVARHYTAAGCTRAAIPWWLRAGRQALAVSACAEASGHLQAGLGLVPTLPRDKQRDALERELLLALGQALLLLRGYGSEDAVEVYDRALALDDDAVPLAQRFEILWGQWMVSSSRKGSSFLKSWELTQRLLALARNSGDPDLLAQAYSAATNITVWRNQLDEACRYAQAAVEQPAGACRGTLEGLDPRVTSLAHLSWAHWRAKRVSMALAASRQSLEMARARDNPDTLCFALAFAALLHRFLDDADTAGSFARELRLHAGLYELALWQGIGDMLMAWKHAREGSEESLPRLKACVQGILQVMPGVAVMFFHALAEACGLLGRRDEQLLAIDEGLLAARRVHEGFFSSLLEQMRHECLAHQIPR